MQVAVVGIGLLGRAVAERLHAVGRTVTVFNRTRAKADPLQSLGIAIADSPAQAMTSADCTLLFLADAAAIHSLVFDPANRSALAGRTLIQMGTISPDESRSFHQAVIAQGGDYLEAPVLGSLAEATAGTLLVMVGGTESQFARVCPLLQVFGRKPRLVGPVGQAAALKLALNQLIAAETVAFSLSLALVQRSDVPVELFMSVLRESAIFAPTFEKKLPRLLQRDYDRPNFTTRHLLKDVELFLTAAQERGVPAATVLGVRDLLTEAIAHGHGDVDYSALYEALNPPPPG